MAGRWGASEGKGEDFLEQEGKLPQAEVSLGVCAVRVASRGGVPRWWMWEQLEDSTEGAW